MSVQNSEGFVPAGRVLSRTHALTAEEETQRELQLTDQHAHEGYKSIKARLCVCNETQLKTHSEDEKQSGENTHLSLTSM